ncbi:DUF4142 domain-containing protein [Methylobacterium currus]|uniref:DUF4142 domain-containing protein n=1 Tax=Methylobacterium currus TaxID=2051553 RepID=UPI001E5A1957|nr:DUF4142 domain-containing protein [Methylobacterium currus]UHC18988.1 DUF4142 domain-containing protein [Methylobacterium currus]
MSPVIGRRHVSDDRRNLTDGCSPQARTEQGRGHSSFAAAATGKTGARMGEAEARYVADILAAGSASLATSRVALSKASGGDVKRFARCEVAEQETIADVLKAMRGPAQTASGQAKPPVEPEVTGQLDPKGKAMLDKLEQAESGKAFDMDTSAARSMAVRRSGRSRSPPSPAARIARRSASPSSPAARSASTGRCSPTSRRI